MKTNTLAVAILIISFLMTNSWAEPLKKNWHKKTERILPARDINNFSGTIYINLDDDKGAEKQIKIINKYKWILSTTTTKTGLFDKTIAKGKIDNEGFLVNLPQNTFENMTSMWTHGKVNAYAYRNGGKIKKIKAVLIKDLNGKKARKKSHKNTKLYGSIYIDLDDERGAEKQIKILNSKNWVLAECPEGKKGWYSIKIATGKIDSVWTAGYIDGYLTKKGEKIIRVKVVHKY